MVAAMLLKKRQPPFVSIVFTAFGGFAFHTGALGLRWLEVGRFPLVIHAEVFSFLGWAIAGYFLLSGLSSRSQTLTSYILPLAIVPTLIAAVLPSPAITPANFETFGDTLLFPLHATMIIFAYASFIITFLAGVIYMWQERELKHKRFGKSLLKLPALDTCDEVSYRSMSIGFVTLTLGIVSGLIWSGRHFGTYLHGDPVEVLTLIVWFLYFFMIHYRVTAGWRGRRTAIIAIIGFVFVLFIMVGLQYLGGFHVFLG